MGVEHRPYVGSWQLAGKQVVQHTPDALVYLNGDLAIPGCPKCNGKIDIQQFVTEVSVDAGVEPGGASASFTLSIPIHHNEAFARDAKFILRPGLEVHIYERGYFPVKGMYSNLDQPQNLKDLEDHDEFTVSGAPLAGLEGGHSTDEFGDIDFSKVPDDLKNKWKTQGMAKDGYPWSTISAGVVEVVERYWQQKYPNAKVWIGSHVDGRSDSANHGQGAATDYRVFYWDENGDKKQVPVEEVWAGTWALENAGRLPTGGNGFYKNPETGKTSSTHYDFRGHYGFPYPKQGGDQWFHITLADGTELNTADSLAWAKEHGGQHLVDAYNSEGASLNPPAVGDEVPNLNQVLGQDTPEETDISPVTKPPDFGESALDEAGLSGKDIENILAYPYYHVFHGVITQVSHSYSGGVQTVSIQCASMLHFWEYQRVSTNASLFGARPHNSKLKMSLVGHNFTGMHPYEIIYKMHHDVAGSAAGVEWALSHKTNQDARSPVTGESLFSLNLRYWERRFQTRDIKLRMHGATGELFNSAQAAWLSQTKSSQLTRLMRERFDKSGQADTGSILQQALSLGMFNNRKLEALQWLRRSQPGGTNAKTPQFEMNMVEMQAFVANIGNFGQVQLFEATYESKLDIIQRVCEVTGFEFYQDVDGDFVFKPPMYNMDTSSSRVYRIEDIDIISINFDEKEPQVTYMTVKGSQIKNLAGHGMENEWGVKGQYIDYRLVAQFGWRPGDYETAYFNDPKSMFFAAVNRMDVMNVPTTSASLTIPLRPEIRPGYPVYIAYLDCFYYNNSFAHSFSVGGQCTTTIQLVGKRSKFYAPGRVDKTGIDAIDLSNTRLPQRPLEVLDKADRPRLAGFPNVVMALDPEQLNPLFFIVGSDVAVLDNEDTINNFLKQAVQLKVLTTEDPSNPGPVYKSAVSEMGNISFYFSESGGSAPSGAKDIRKLAGAYNAHKAAYVQKRDEQLANIRKWESDLVTLDSQVRNLKPAADHKVALDKIAKDWEKLEKQIKDANSHIRAEELAFWETLEPGQQTDISYLNQLISVVGESYKTKQQTEGETFGDINSPSSLLDMLSDKKSIMTNGTLPGTYRYYSASHPSKEHQGQLQPNFKVKKSVDDKAVETSNPFLEAVWKGPKVIGFVEDSKKTVAAGDKVPAATLGEMEPEWGIKVFTNNPEAPSGEVLPTSEIRELMFASHKVSLKKPLTTTSPKSSHPDLTKGSQKSLGTAFYQKVLASSDEETRLTSTLGAITKGPWEELAQKFVDAAVAAKAALPAAQQNKVPAFPALAFPSGITFRNTSIPMSAVMGEYDFIGATAGGDTAFSGGGGYTVEQFYKAASKGLGYRLFRDMESARKSWFKVMKISQLSEEDAKLALSTFNGLAGAGTSQRRSKVKTRKLKTYKGNVQSPVFPVSDAGGYEVIGAFRYGRDVDIDPEGVFAVMHAQDPLQLLDKHTIDQVVRAFIKGQPITITTTETGLDGKTKTVKKTLAAPEARTALEKIVLEKLQTRLTDKQILDLGLAVETDDPNVLQFGLSNWFAEKGKDGIQKVPINNAAYSLADMTLAVGKNVCQCKMAEANTLLEAAGQEDFVKFVAPATTVPTDYGDGTQDRVTSWLMSTSAERAVGWQMSRDALAGSLPDQRPTSIVDTIKGSKEAFDAAGAKTGAAVAALGPAVTNIVDASGNLQSAFTQGAEED